MYGALVNALRKGFDMVVSIKQLRAGWLALLSLLLMASLLMAPPAFAGGLAMSGSFYRQEFEIPQGTSLNTPDVYVVVFNNSDEEFNIRMTTETPTGVELLLSEKDFPPQGR